MDGNASSMQLHLKCIANLIQIYSQCYISLLTVIFCTFFEGGQKKIASRFRAGKKKIFFACISVLMYQMNLGPHKEAILRRLTSKLNFDRSLPPPPNR